MKKKLTFLLFLMIFLVAGCSKKEPDGIIQGISKTGSLKLDYAKEFSIDYYGDYRLIKTGEGKKYLVVPDGEEPVEIGSDVNVIRRPLSNVYVAATSSMSLLDELGVLDSIRFSGTKADGWYIDNAKAAMENGNILFAGKYNQPDYEMLVKESCPLAIESMMIGHASDVENKLNELGITVFTDESSNEEHPLGRCEWIKLYGALFGKEEEAEAFFNAQKEKISFENDSSKEPKTVAFFYISEGGKVVTRKSDDYVCKMIELAGGKYIFDDIGDHSNKMSTVNLEMESFYETAKDADVIIYNSTIGGEVKSLSDLLKKNELIKDFKAVKEGNVWCTGKNMYQETTKLGEMIKSFHDVFCDDGSHDEFPFLYRLK